MRESLSITQYKTACIKSKGSSMTPMYRHRQIVFTRTLETAGVDMRALAGDNIHLRRLVWTCEH